MLKMAIAEIRYNYIYFAAGHVILLGLYLAYILTKGGGWDTIFRILGSFSAVPLYISFILKFTQKWETMAARIPVKPSAIAISRLVPTALYLLINAGLLILAQLILNAQAMDAEFYNHIYYLTCHIYLLMTILLMIRDTMVHFKNSLIRVILSYIAIAALLLVMFADRLHNFFRALKLEDLAQWYADNLLDTFESFYLIILVVVASLLGAYLYKVRETYLDK
jgi:hypothetical protein